MKQSFAVLFVLLAAWYCGSTNAAGLRTRTADGICAAETAAVTAAHNKVVSAENNLKQANANYKEILRTCNTYHFAEIKLHPECPQDESDKGRYNEIVQPASDALAAAKAQIGRAGCLSPVAIAAC